MLGCQVVGRGSEENVSAPGELTLSGAQLCTVCTKSQVRLCG